MSVDTNAGFDSQAATGVYTPVLLIRANFSDGTLYLTPYGFDVKAMNQVFKGVSAIKPGPIKESEDGASQKIELSLNGVRQNNLALAMGSAETYQGRPVTIWLGMINPENGRLSGTPVMRFNGSMESMAIKRDPSEGGDDNSVVMTCRSGSYSDTVKTNSLRLTNRQQQQRHPGDRGLEFVSSLIAKPTVWLTKRFQEV